MAVIVLALAIIVLLTTTAESQARLETEALSCRANGTTPAMCQVGGHITSDNIWNLELVLIREYVPNGCNQNKYRLQITEQNVFVRVEDGCEGYFEVRSAVPKYPKYQKGICGVNNPGTGFRIVGGHVAEPCQYPWMVQVLLITPEKTNHCGGSIIDNRHILTAGHCVYPQRLKGSQPAKYFKVYSGSLDKLYGYVEREVEKVFIHPDYDTVLLHNDIAILRLKKEIKYDSCHSPICLTNDTTLTPGRQCRVMGWGKAHPLRPIWPRILKWKVDPMISRVDCEKFYGTDLGNDSICGKGSAFCAADSGGPYICQGDDRSWYQYGIVSGYVNGPLPCSFEGKYTLAPYFKKWIDSQTKLT